MLRHSPQRFSVHPPRRSWTRRIGGGPLVAVAVAALTACGAADSAPPVAEGDGASGAGSWEDTDPAPVREREGFQSLEGLVAGEQALVVSGATGSATKLKALAFDSASGEWRRLADSPLSFRVDYSATVGDSDQLIVWGGATNTGSGVSDDGAVYDLREERWSRIAEAPIGARYGHTAVWTDDEMLVWGGGSADDEAMADGASYDPEVDAWDEIPVAPVEPRLHHTAIWTGSQMLIWGGLEDDRGQLSGRPDRDRSFSDGASYDPAANRWLRIPEAPIDATPTAQAVWTGDRMLVWTGSEAALYDPDSQSWTVMSETPLSPRQLDSAVWTGEELIVWGGTEQDCGDCFLNDGAALDPAQDRWTRLPEAPLTPRDRHTSVWLGDSMLIWGGCCDGSRYLRDGALYRPGG